MLEEIKGEKDPTVLDVVAIIKNGKKVLFHADSPMFEYQRTTKKREQVDVLPRFIPLSDNIPVVTDVIRHTSRANISLQTLVKGRVELPENEFDLTFVPSQIFRTYNIIRDGFVNIEHIHVTVDKDTFGLLNVMLSLSQMKVVEKMKDGSVSLLLNLINIPVISRQMTANVSLDEFKSLSTALIRSQGIVKGIKASVPTEDRKPLTMENEYGVEAAQWLSSIGVRDYGFIPKSKPRETTNHYVTTEVTWKLKGISSLPSVKEVMAKVEAKKTLTTREKLVYNGVTKAENVDDAQELLSTHQAEVKELQHLLSDMVFTLIIGKTWFAGEEDDVNTVVRVEDKDIPLTIEKRRVEVEV